MERAIVRADVEHVYELSALCNRSGTVPLKTAFGPFSSTAMLETSHLTLLITESQPQRDDSQVSQKDIIRGVMCISDTPKLSGDDVDSFTNKIDDVNELLPVTKNNTLFLNFWCIEEDSAVGNLDKLAFDMVVEAFSACPAVDFIVYLCPMKAQTSLFMDKNFYRVDKPGDESNENQYNGLFDDQKLLYLHRSKFCPRLAVREAITEDNDELLPILEAFEPELMQGKNNYFIAELIDNQNDMEKVFVGLRDDNVKGVLATSTNVEVEPLLDIFELEAIENMIIREAEKPPPPPSVISIMGDLRQLDVETIAREMKCQDTVFVNMQTMEVVYPIGEGSFVDDKDVPLKIKISSDSLSDEKEMSAESKDVKSDASDAKDESHQQSTADSKADSKHSEEKTQLQSKGDADKKDDEKNDSDGKNEMDAKDSAPTHSVQKQTIPEVVNNVLSSMIQQPSAIVLFGYTRIVDEPTINSTEEVGAKPTEEEAPPAEEKVDGVSINEAESEVIFDDEFINTVNFILDFKCSHEDVDHYEDDEMVQSHLISLELLHDEYDKHRFENKPHGKWVTVESMEMEPVDNARPICHNVFKILEERNRNIELERSQKRTPKVNAFTINLFAMEELSISRSEDLLKLAFESHPNHDYCLYQLPNSRPPTQLTRCFKHIPIKGLQSTNQVLYVVHRLSFIAKEYMTIERCLPIHMAGLSQFVGTLREESTKEIILQSAQRSQTENDVELGDNPAEVTFLVLIHNSVVGCVQLSRSILTEEDSDWMCANYKVADVVNMEKHSVRAQAAVISFVLNPIYSVWARHVMREVMREYGKTVFFYNAPNTICPEILEHFIHVCPRRRMETPSDGSAQIPYLERPSKSKGGLGRESPLYVISKRHLSSQKNNIFKRVVIAGGSSHSYAFLESLCFMPDYNFHNVFLVVGSLPRPFQAENATDSTMYDDDYCGVFTRKCVDFPTENELYAMGFRHKLKIIQGNVTDIDREAQAVIINDENLIEYDLLLVSGNTQNNSISNYKATAKKHTAACADAGILCLDNPTADLLALRWLKSRDKRSEPIVIIGPYIDVMVAAARILSMGIEPKRVVAVVSDNPLGIEGVDDKAIAEKLSNIARINGIRIYWSYKVIDFNMNRVGFVQSVIINRIYQSGTKDSEENSAVNETKKTEDRDLNLPCSVVLLCGNKQCVRNIFYAVNDCGLVFDGGLIVDEAFRTVDPAIYAVSDYTRFSSIYKDECFLHSRYNSRELGFYVAQTIFSRHFDPKSSAFIADRLSLKQLFPSHSKRLPKFRLPQSYVMDMPGRIQFFNSKLYTAFSASQVSLPTACSYQQNSKTRTRSVVVKLANYGIVSELMYIGEEQVEPRNLSLIPGIHESFLNSAMFCYEKGILEDWIQFLRGSWANILYHDRFPVLVERFRVALRSDHAVIMLYDKIATEAETVGLDAHEDITKLSKSITGPYCEKMEASTLDTISTHAVNFLKQHRADFNNYYLHSK